jgi:hypothetical protein
MEVDRYLNPPGASGAGRETSDTVFAGIASQYDRWFSKGEHVQGKAGGSLIQKCLPES